MPFIFINNTSYIIQIHTSGQFNLNILSLELTTQLYKNNFAQFSGPGPPADRV
jgi:hypothetical protein